MFKLTIRAKDVADMRHQLEMLAFGTLALDPTVTEPVQQQQWPAKPKVTNEAPKTRGRPRKDTPPMTTAAALPPAEPELEPEPTEEEPAPPMNGADTDTQETAPPLDTLIKAITAAVIADKNPQGRVRIAVAALKPQLQVEFIAKCTEAHRPVLWQFVQDLGIAL